MESTSVSGLSGPVSYEEAPIALVDTDGEDGSVVSYRVDLGRGSAVAVSSRAEGTWVWTAVSEGRWDGVRLRVKGLDRQVVAALERALLLAARAQAEGGA